MVPGMLMFCLRPFFFLFFSPFFPDVAVFQIATSTMLVLFLPSLVHHHTVWLVPWISPGVVDLDSCLFCLCLLPTVPLYNLFFSATDRTFRYQLPLMQWFIVMLFFPTQVSAAWGFCLKIHHLGPSFWCTRIPFILGRDLKLSWSCFSTAPWSGKGAKHPIDLVSVCNALAQRLSCSYSNSIWP